MKKTKIVATIGPSSSSKEVLREMILSGLNICRLNFSHGMYDDHLAAIKQIDNYLKQKKTIKRQLYDYKQEYEKLIFGGSAISSH